MLLTVGGRRAVYNTFAFSLTGTRAVSSDRPQLNTQGKPSWKHPSRGGQNLSQRYQRLQRSLRGKGAYQQEIVDLIEDAAGSSSAGIGLGRDNAKTFMGYVVPELPKPPGPEECCMSGCAICVHDLYNEALEEYNNAVDTLRTSLKMLHIPESRWPEEIQTTRAPSQVEQNVALNAFEELERRLKEKRAATAAAPNAALPPSRRPRQKRIISADVACMYEGLRWLIFSNR